MKGIDRIPFNFKEIPITPVTVGTYDIPSNAVGCIIRVQPQGSGGRGRCTLSFEGGGGADRSWQRQRDGSSGHGHNFGITTQVLFVADENGKLPDKVKLSSTHGVNTNTFSIIAWIGISSTGGLLNRLPFKTHYIPDNFTGNRDVDVPKDTCAVHMRADHYDGNGRLARLTFNNKCKTYDWFKAKGGGSGYRYSPVYEDIIWLLEDEDGKYPTSVNINNSEGGNRIRIKGWIKSGEAPEIEPTVNIFNPSVFYLEDSEDEVLGYSETDGEGKITPLRFETVMYGRRFWFEPNLFYQANVEEAPVSGDVVFTVFGSALSGNFDIGTASNFGAVIFLGHTSRTVFTITTIICQNELLLLTAGIRISDLQLINNPFNLTEGKDSKLTLIGILPSSIRAMPDLLPYKKAIVEMNSFYKKQNETLESYIKKHGIYNVFKNSEMVKIVNTRFIESAYFEINRRTLLNIRNSLIKEPLKYEVDMDWESD